MRSHQIAALILTIAAPLSAQRLEVAQTGFRLAEQTAPATQPSAAIDVAQRTTASTGEMVLGGVIGAVAGAFAGAVVGSSAENCGENSDDFCGLAGGILGGLLGEAIGVPIGVNWVANGKGTLVTTIPLSLGLTAGLTVVGAMTGGVGILLIPPMQIWMAIRSERRAM